MKKNKFCFIIGTRPQFVKFFPLFRQLKKKKINFFSIDTGQHYDYELSQIFKKEFKMCEFNYLLKRKSLDSIKSLTDQIILLNRILIKENPNFVVVFGDTDSTLSGALTASKLNIPIIHIEAGMRSNDLRMQEEKNRKIVDQLSQIFFCSCKRAIKNLKDEKILNSNYGSRLFNVGDLMLDSIGLIKDKINSVKEEKRNILLTIHRDESIANKSKLESMIKELSRLSENYNITFPLHPKTRKRIIEFNLMKLLESSKIKIIKPLSYINNIRYLLSSELIITDSGGMQKEAYFFKKPCFTLRNSTEWIETIEEGWNVLISNNPKNLKKIIQQFKLPKKNKCTYGRGNTAEKIVNILKGLS